MNQSNGLAVALLAIGASRHYGWALADVQHMGVASKALGAIAALCLLAIVWANFSSWLLTPVIVWYGFEELQTAVCSVMFLIEPWHVEAGQSMCSARISFDLGAVGIAVVGYIAYRLAQQDRKKQ